MTPAELFDYLLSIGVRLTPTEGDGVYVHAPKGAITAKLRAVMQSWKPALRVLALPPQQGAFLPMAPVRSWITGGKVAVAMVQMDLGAPLYHDTPRQPGTFIGLPCDVKKCARVTDARGQLRSVRFWPTGICTQCWERWDKKGMYTVEKLAKAAAKHAKQREATLARVAYPEFAVIE